MEEEYPPCPALPCPFGGSKDLDVTHMPQVGDFDEGYWVICRTCGITGPKAARHDLARKAWNTRYQPSPTRKD